MAVGPLAAPGESVAVDLEGERTFLRRIEIPERCSKAAHGGASLRARVGAPFELSEAVYDHAVLRRVWRRRNGCRCSPWWREPKTCALESRSSRKPSTKSPSASRPAGSRSASLSAVVPELAVGRARSQSSISRRTRSELVILERGEPVFARTLRVARRGFPSRRPRWRASFVRPSRPGASPDGARPRDRLSRRSGRAAPGAQDSSKASSVSR